MTNSKKSDLISSLAAEMGIFTDADTKYGGSRYDATTGTLYCNGMTLPNSSLESIKSWFRSQMLNYQDLMEREPKLKDMYIKMSVAYNAILLLKENMDD